MDIMNVLLQTQLLFVGVFMVTTLVRFRKMEKTVNEMESKIKRDGRKIEDLALTVESATREVKFLRGRTVELEKLHQQKFGKDPGCFEHVFYEQGCTACLQVAYGIDHAMPSNGNGPIERQYYAGPN